MEKTKIYLITDEVGNRRLVREASPRQAVLTFLGLEYGLSPKGKTFPIYRDIDGKTFQVGWGMGRHWCSVGEYIPFQKEM